MDLKLEQVEVHSRDIFVRYLSAKAGQSLYYSIKPERHSICYGLYKTSRERAGTSSLNAKQKSSTSLATGLSLGDRLDSAGLRLVQNGGKIPGGKVRKGTFACQEDGMYALVFDNTFSKQTAKRVLFIIQVESTAGVHTHPSNAQLVDDDCWKAEAQEDHLTGYLLKRRRKKLQGWASRYFVLDFGDNALHYYLNSSATAQRGAIPLKLAVISADAARLEINVDSGAEVWNLRARNSGAFSMWCQALLAATKSKDVPRVQPGGTPTKAPDKQTWLRIGAISQSLTEVQASLRETLSDDKLDTPKSETGRPFWPRRKSQLEPMVPPSDDGSQLKLSLTKRTMLLDAEARLSDAMQKLNALLTEHKLGISFAPRLSIDSTRSVDDVFEDANEVWTDDGLLVAHHDSDDNSDLDTDKQDSDGESDLDVAETMLSPQLAQPVHQRDLYPLNESPPARRSTVPPIVDQPPSLAAMLRKSLGSDISAQSAPAGSNEPLSLVQRAAEDFEYASLLDLAARAETNDGSRILLVAAFAVSGFASMRHRVRAIRKPFNPLLGETYELCRPEQGFRLLAEKVVHRPTVGVALQCESRQWTTTQYAATSQKFYGKSLELITQGQTTIAMGDDVFSYEKPICYLRNAAMGEKYLEPAGEMTIAGWNGDRAVVQFKAGGMFSGRSEEVTITAVDKFHQPYDKSLTGTWTSSLRWNSSDEYDGQIAWQAGALLPEPEKHCGFPAFTAQLNELTPMEIGKLAPTDARLRPDLRAREEGRLDDAQRLKEQLEGQQRQRRQAGQEISRPLFFEPAEDGQQQSWRLRTDAEGDYWGRRKRGDWRGLPQIFELS